MLGYWLVPNLIIKINAISVNSCRARNVAASTVSSAWHQGRQWQKSHAEQKANMSLLLHSGKSDSNSLVSVGLKMTFWAIFWHSFRTLMGISSYQHSCSASTTGHILVHFRIYIITKSLGLKNSPKSWVWRKTQNTRYKFQLIHQPFNHYTKIQTAVSQSLEISSTEQISR